MDRSVFLSDIDGTLVRGDVLPAPEVSRPPMFSGRRRPALPAVPAEVWREPALWRSH